MFADESYIISFLINSSIATITKCSIRENIVILTSCSLKMDFTDLPTILFFRVWFFSCTGDITWLFHFETVLVDAFSIWHSLDELIKTSLYFFTSFFKSNLFLFSILWAFGYELPKLSLLTILRFPDII